MISYDMYTCWSWAIDDSWSVYASLLILIVYLQLLHCGIIDKTIAIYDTIVALLDISHALPATIDDRHARVSDDHTANVNMCRVYIGNMLKISLLELYVY